MVFTDLSPQEYGKTLVAEFVELADTLRDMQTEFGMRPYKVRRVKVQWSRGRRGEGQPMILEAQNILPTPLAKDMSSLNEILQPFGLKETGGIVVSEMSGRYSEEFLKGLGEDGSEIPKDQEIFWEVEFPRPDGQASIKRRFSLSTVPFYDAENLQWTINLTKTADNRHRNGDIP
jgi:hypothetical protein